MLNNHAGLRPRTDCGTVRNFGLILDPGKPSVKILAKEGVKIERYKASGKIGQGESDKAGTAYRMLDGAMIYLLG